MKFGSKIVGGFMALALVLCTAMPAMAAERTSFSDVDANSWYAEAVNWCSEKGIMNGTESGTFSPGGAMTRAMLSAVLYRAAGSPAVNGNAAFSDTSAGAYYSDAVSWAAGKGLMTGYGNGVFGVNDPVTREQLAAILWRYAGSPAAGGTNSFADSDDIADYARAAANWAQANGIISGKDEKRFDPQGKATRAEVAAILYRYFNSASADEPDTTPAAPTDPGAGATGSTESPSNPASTTNPGTEAENMKTNTYTLNGVNFKMVLVKAGTFTMGSDNANAAFSESPAHQVTLTKDYLMGETEVTEALWNAVMGNGGGSNTHPKTSVTWNDAHVFVDKLNELAHAQGIIAADLNFHLPTEAQWEFAAKGGNESKGYLYSGSDNIDDVAVTRENSGSDSPSGVKQKAPNELGLYDMSGNAYEWVDDYAGSYSATAQTDPQNTTKSNQYVKRGGSNYHSFDSESYLFTTTGRYFYGSTDWTIGFRICLY